MLVVTEEETHPVAACPDRLAHVEAARRVREIEASLDRAGAPSHGTLVDEFRAVLRLLERRGYVTGWDLEPPGTRLRRIYSEQDLLVSECLRGGIFSGCDDAELAALISAFVFEPRAEEVRDAFPNERTAAIGSQVMEVWRGIVADERSLRLQETRPPEFGFASLAYAWCQGADLDDLIDRSPVPAGDFVRVARQLLDLLRQVRDAEPALAGVARAALRSVDRGIVTTGGNE
jgi:ATP-dependent RNA helicase HelY